METMTDAVRTAFTAAPSDTVAVASASVSHSQPWYLRGACRGLEAAVFYPDPDSEVEVARALDICARCGVRDACLDHALTRRESTGIWGGTTERERRWILRRRRSA